MVNLAKNKSTKATIKWWVSEFKALEKERRQQDYTLLFQSGQSKKLGHLVSCISFLKYPFVSREKLFLVFIDFLEEVCTSIGEADKFPKNGASDSVENLAGLEYLFRVAAVLITSPDFAKMQEKDRLVAISANVRNARDILYRKADALISYLDTGLIALVAEKLVGKNPEYKKN